MKMTVSRNNVQQLRPLMVNAAVQQRYQSEIENLTRTMLKESRVKFTALFSAPVPVRYAQDSAGQTARVIELANLLLSKFEKLFAVMAHPTASRMVKETDRQSSMTMRDGLLGVSAQFSVRTDLDKEGLREVMKASIAENVDLIKSIPRTYLEKVKAALLRSIITGNGLEEFMPALMKYEKMTADRARLIAVDQSRKVYSAINRLRMESLGIKKFKWLHSAGGQQPRKDHVDMNGKIYRFDDPPVIDQRTGERGFPGQLINCRCVMVPVIELGAI